MSLFTFSACGVAPPRVKKSLIIFNYYYDTYAAHPVSVFLPEPRAPTLPPFRPFPPLSPPTACPFPPLSPPMLTPFTPLPPPMAGGSNRRGGAPPQHPTYGIGAGKPPPRLGGAQAATERAPAPCQSPAAQKDSRRHVDGRRHWPAAGEHRPSPPPARPPSRHPSHSRGQRRREAAAAAAAAAAAGLALSRSRQRLAASDGSAATAAKWDAAQRVRQTRPPPPPSPPP